MVLREVWICVRERAVWWGEVTMQGEAKRKTIKCVKNVDNKGDKGRQPPPLRGMKGQSLFKGQKNGIEGFPRSRENPLPTKRFKL
jgi:hypothetical protein